jgi:hypothetical protein
MAHMDNFENFNVRQKIILIIFCLIIGWGSLYLTDLYFSNWSKKWQAYISGICWASCSIGIYKLIDFIGKKKQ